MEKAKGSQTKTFLGFQMMHAKVFYVNFQVLPFFSVTTFVTQLEITEILSTRLHASVQLPLKRWYFYYVRIYIACVQTDSQ